MAYSSVNIHNALSQCHYDSQLKAYIYQEISGVVQSYRTLNTKPVQLQQGNSFYTVIELYGTMPAFYSNASYNIPIKIQYPVGYPTYSPVL